MGLRLVLAVLAANAGVAYWNTGRVFANGRAVAHTHEVLAEVAGVLSAVQDAETGQRGYLVTGDPAYLQPYDAALASVGSRLGRLRDLTQDNPGQQARIASLEGEITAKLAELAETVRLRRGRGFDAAQKVMLSGRGKAEMDRIRTSVAEMQREEADLLGEREQEASASLSWAAGTFSLATGVACGVVVLGYALARRDLLGRRRAEEAERRQREWLQVVLASVGDGVVATDPKGRVAFLNSAAEALTGWARGDAVGLPLAEVVRTANERTREEAESPAMRVLREGNAVGLANHTRPHRPRRPREGDRPPRHPHPRRRGPDGRGGPGLPRHHRAPPRRGDPGPPRRHRRGDRRRRDRQDDRGRHRQLERGRREALRLAGRGGPRQVDRAARPPRKEGRAGRGHARLAGGQPIPPFETVRACARTARAWTWPSPSPPFGPSTAP